MKALIQMSDAELKGMQARTDRLLSEQAGRMASTPKDTPAYEAMVASRPGLIAFRDDVDREIDRRGF